ncbi:MAG TPA: hypothetical protein VIN58_24410 [Roseateles sp.]
MRDAADVQRIARWRLLVAVGWSLVLAITSPAHAGWTRIDTEHFAILVDGADKKQARTYGWQLEVFHAAALGALGVPDSDARNVNRFEIILLRDAAQLQRVKPNLSPTTVGVYLQCRDGAIALASRKEQRSIWFDRLAEEVLFHEVAHRLMFKYHGMMYPRWFVEGFAEYMSGTHVRSQQGAALMGTAPGHIKDVWQPMGELSFSTLLADAASDITSDQDFYRHSWALTHYMLFDAQRTEALTRYLDKVVLGGNPVQVFESVTGIAVRNLKQNIDLHINTFRSVTSKTSAPDSDQIKVEITPLVQSQSEFILTGAALRLCPSEDHGKSMLEDLRRVRQERDRPSRELRMALARAELNWGDAEAAKAELDAVLSEDPRSFEAHHLLGRAWMKLAGLHAGEERLTRLNAAREHLFKAYALNKLDAPNHYQIALLLSPDSTDPNLLTAARNAHGLEPTVVEYAVLEALVDLEAGDSALAIDALRPIASNPHNPKLSIRVRSAIQAIQAGRGVNDVAAILNSRD